MTFFLFTWDELHVMKISERYHAMRYHIQTYLSSWRTPWSAVAPRGAPWRRRRPTPMPAHPQECVKSWGLTAEIFDWCRRTRERPRFRSDVGGVKNDLSFCAVSKDDDQGFEVPDPDFPWRSALDFSPRVPQHAKRSGFRSDNTIVYSKIMSKNLKNVVSTFHDTVLSLNTKSYRVISRKSMVP